MVIKGKEKLTIAFSTYESEQLNSLQFSYLFGKNKLSILPSVNEILKATVVYALLKTTNGGLLKTFTNGFLRRRNLRLEESEEEEIDTSEFDLLRTKEIEDETSEGETSKGSIKEGKLPKAPPGYVSTRTGNYSFYFDNNDLARVSDLKKRVSRVSGIRETEISNTEIVRETIHFIFDREDRNISFRYITYIGVLYDLSPSISVVLNEIDRGKISTLLLKSQLDATCDYRDLRIIKDLKKEKEIVEELVEAVKEFSNLMSPDDIIELIFTYNSRIGDFDYFKAFIGGEMLYYTSKYNLTEIADVALFMMVKDKRKTNVKAGIDLFKFYADIFFGASEKLSK